MFKSFNFPKSKLTFIGLKDLVIQLSSYSKDFYICSSEIPSYKQSEIGDMNNYSNVIIRPNICLYDRNENIRKW